MCWVALDRLLQLHRSGFIRRLPADKFERERDAIRADVERAGFNPAIDSYTQRLGGDTVDASLLLLGRYGYTAPADARMRGTYRAIMDRLRAAPGLHLPRRDQPAPGRGRVRHLQRLGHRAPGGRRRLAGRGGRLVPAVPRLRQRPGPVRRGGRSGDRRGARQLSAGVQPRRPDRGRAGHRGAAARGASHRPRGSAPAAGAGSERADMNWTSWLLWGFAATAVLTTVMAGSEGVGLTRMNIPHMLGTMFTANRDRAKVYGAALHFLNGWAFSIVYVAGFHAAHRFTWWFGMFLGLDPRPVRRRRRAAGDAGRPPAHGERAARTDRRAPAGTAGLPGAELRRAHADLRADRAPRVRRDARRPLFAGRFQARPARGVPAPHRWRRPSRACTRPAPAAATGRARSTPASRRRRGRTRRSRADLGALLVERERRARGGARRSRTAEPASSRTS